MKIQIVGVGCDKCTKLYDHVIEAVQNLNISPEIIKVEDLLEIVKLGVMTTPALVIDGRLAFSGTVPSVKKIEKYLI